MKPSAIVKPDPEATAKVGMAISSQLKRISVEEVEHVLRFVGAFYGLDVRRSASAGNSPSTNEMRSRREIAPDASANQTPVTATFWAIADLFERAAPAAGPARALVAGYWFQKVRGQAAFTGADVNSELKHLGHQLANVTVTLNLLIHQKPQLAMQVSKSGKAQQARKQYQLTRAGIVKVEAMLQGEGSS